MTPAVRKVVLRGRPSDDEDDVSSVERQAMVVDGPFTVFVNVNTTRQAMTPAGMVDHQG